MTHSPPSRILRTLASLVPASHRAEWLQEWHAETLHGGALRTMLAAAEDAVRFRLRTPGTTWRDAGTTLRALRRTPVWTFSVVATLGVGLGATLTIFTLVYGVLLRPLPYADSGRLMAVEGTVTYPIYEQLRARQQVWNDVGAWSGTRRLIFAVEGRPEDTRGVLANAALFESLGVAPLLGRWPTDAEDQPDRGAVLLSWGLWQERFGGSPDIIGTVIEVNEHPHEIIGVMPRAFAFPNRSTRMWASLTTGSRSGQAWYLQLGGRVRPQVSPAAAHAALAGITLDDTSADDGSVAPLRLTPISLHDRLVGSASSLLFFQAAVIALLLIACVNVTHLLSARATDRSHELAIRAALGAGRRHLVKLMLTEALLLGLLGGVVGLGLAAGGVRMLLVGTPLSLPLQEQVSVDGPVWAMALTLAMAVGLFVGVVPALRLSRGPVNGRLRSVSRTQTDTGARHRLFGSLITAQIALALALLVGAGLLMRSFVSLRTLDSGFDTDTVFAVGVALPEAAYPDQAPKARFYDALLTRLRAVPGVTHAAVAASLPFTGSYSTGSFEIEGLTLVEAPEMKAEVQVAGPDYFSTMGIGLVTGRDFGTQAGAEHVAIVNEHLARTYFPEGDAIGQRVRGFYEREDQWFTIVGIADDTRHRGLDRAPTNQIYLPYATARWPWSMAVTVRTSGEVALTSLSADVQHLVDSLDSRLARPTVRALSDIKSASVVNEGFEASLVAAFAVVALMLSVIGIYGAVAQSVTRRTRELGIRLALGAQRSTLISGVIGSTLTLTGVGLLVGLVLAGGVNRLLATYLFNMHPGDPLVFAGASAALALAALVAALIPARRVARLNPLSTLRGE